MLDVGKRLRRMRGRFHRYIYVAILLARQRAKAQVWQVFDPELPEELQEPAHAA